MSRHAYKCCIPECQSKGAVSHRFPNPKKNRDTFMKWVEVIDTNLKTIDPSIVYYKKRVCSLHFNSDDISPGTANKLKANVVPTLHIPVVPIDVEVSASCSSDKHVNVTPTHSKAPIVPIDVEVSASCSSDKHVNVTPTHSKAPIVPIDVEVSASCSSDKHVNVTPTHSKAPIVPIDVEVSASCSSDQENQ